VHPTWAPFLGMTLVSSDGAGGGYGGASVMASTAE
jgi:hypothetical protein